MNPLFDLPSKILTFSSNTRKRLDVETKVWVVRKGKGELFFEREGGALHFLGSFKENDLLLGFSSSSFVFLMSAQSKVVVEEFELEDVIRALESHPKADSVNLFKEWFLRFEPLFAFKEKEEVDRFATLWSTFKVAVGEKIALESEDRKALAWAKTSLGFFPLGHVLFFETQKEEEISIFPTDALILQKHFYETLLLFQKTVFERLVLQLRFEEEFDKGRMAKRAFLDKKLFKNALNKIGSIFVKRATFTYQRDRDPIFNTCQRIGFEEGMTFKEPNFLSKDVDQRVKEIAMASKIGYRRVELVDSWWNKDCLYLLGFYEKTKSPVALINHKPNSYTLYDLIQNSKVKVTEEVAKKLSPYAYLFYPAFPDEELTIFSLLRFTLNRRKKDLLALIFMGFFGAILSLIPPFLNAALFDRVVRLNDGTLLLQIVLALFGATFGIGVFLFTRSFAVFRLMQLIDIKLESALWDRLLRLPVSFFRAHTVGNLIERIYSLINVRMQVGGAVIKALFSALFSIFYFIAMLYYSPLLSFMGMGVVLIGALIALFSFWLKSQVKKKSLNVRGGLQGIVLELIAGIAKIRTNGAEMRGFNFWASTFSELQRLNFQERRYINIIQGIVAALPIVATGVLFLSVSQVLKSQKMLSVGEFIAFLAAFTPFSFAILEALNSMSGMTGALPLWRRVKVILEATPEDTSSKLSPGKLQGELSVDHLVFKYEKEGPLVLDEISLHVSPQEFIAIVGPSNSGKSTLARLLLGFETPTNGAIFYDGKELSKLNLLELRRQIGSLLQNSSLFFGSLYENIVCGGIYSQSQIDEALSISGFDRDLKEFPMGLRTIIQSGGSTLSLGQVQKILISRALLSKPKIVLFDEATSALDNLAQDEVTAALAKLDVTRIVIAHRLSTIKKADRIYVMERGRVVQTGTFEHLASQEGLFKQMLQLQTI